MGKERANATIEGWLRNNGYATFEIFEVREMGGGNEVQLSAFFYTQREEKTERKHVVLSLDKGYRVVGGYVEDVR